MGSLVPGWDSLSPRGDHRVIRTRSFTKEEIEEFWSKRKMEEEEHKKAAEALREKRSDRKNDEVDGIDSTTSMHQILNPNTNWWTRSNWAFLNEQPAETKRSDFIYVPQFNIVNL